MFTEEGFAKTAKQLAELNQIDLELALELLADVGDALLSDGSGLVIARSRNGTVYRRKWPDDDD